jgi:hypothetical protein
LSGKVLLPTTLIWRTLRALAFFDVDIDFDAVVRQLLDFRVDPGRRTYRD